METPPVGDPEVAVDMTSVLQRAATASISAWAASLSENSTPEDTSIRPLWVSIREPA